MQGLHSIIELWQMEAATMTEQQALQHTTPEIRAHYKSTGYLPEAYNEYKVGQMVWWDGDILLITKFTDDVSDDGFYSGRVYYIYKGQECWAWLGHFQQEAIPLFFGV